MLVLLPLLLILATCAVVPSAQHKPPHLSYSIHTTTTGAPSKADCHNATIIYEEILVLGIKATQFSCDNAVGSRSNGGLDQRIDDKLLLQFRSQDWSSINSDTALMSTTLDAGGTTRTIGDSII